MIVAIVIFLAAWLAGVASWFLAWGEGLRVERFDPRTFDRGLRVLRETRALPPPSAVVGTTFEAAHGRFSVTQTDRVLFRAKTYVWLWRTPLTFKCGIRWNGPVATVEGRLPVFPTAFCAAFLIGWTAFAAGVANDLTALAVGWLFVAGMVVLSLPLERYRVHRLVDEYAQAA